MDPIKEAFSKAKSDISSLKDSIAGLSVEVNEIKSLLSTVVQHIDIQNQTLKQSNPAHYSALNKSLDNNIDFWAHKALKPHVYNVSTGNKGVPADRQTNQQTDTTSSNPFISTGDILKESNTPNISDLLNSLDSYKKDLRNKFKKLTKQEMLVFSAIYQLEQEGFVVDYPLLAKKLSLTESSIRDYIQRIIKKNIPLIKKRENNKKIYLSISQDLMKVASLETILQLREL